MKLAEILQEALPEDAIEEVVEEGTHPSVRIQGSHLVDAARALKKGGMADMLHLISGVDYADHMEVVYHFATFQPAELHCIKVRVPRDEPVVPTLTGEWEAADWLERETWDMLGIRFDGHPHHYRILLGEDWEGHPLRKDYVFPTEYRGIDCTQ